MVELFKSSPDIFSSTALRFSLRCSMLDVFGIVIPFFLLSSQIIAICDQGLRSKKESEGFISPIL